MRNMNIFILVIMCLIDNYWFSIIKDKKTTCILKVNFRKNYAQILYSRFPWGYTNSKIMNSLRLNKYASKCTMDKDSQISGY